MPCAHPVCTWRRLNQRKSRASIDPTVPKVNLDTESASSAGPRGHSAEAIEQPFDRCSGRWMTCCDAEVVLHRDDLAQSVHHEDEELRADVSLEQAIAGEDRPERVHLQLAEPRSDGHDLVAHRCSL